MTKKVYLIVSQDPQRVQSAIYAIRVVLKYVRKFYKIKATAESNQRGGIIVKFIT